MAKVKEYEGHKDWWVCRPFSTDGFGPWQAGARVTLLFDEFEFVNRSSPGNPEHDDPAEQSPVLVTQKQWEALKKKSGKTPANNRQVTGSQNRGEGDDQGGKE